MAPSNNAAAQGRKPSEAELRAAIDFYEHAKHAGDRPVHHLDLLESEEDWGIPAYPPRAARRRGETPADGPHLTHEIARPGWLAFKLGIGFAAGAWLLRTLLLLITGTALVLLLWQLLEISLGFSL